MPRQNEQTRVRHEFDTSSTLIRHCLDTNSTVFRHDFDTTSTPSRHSSIVEPTDFDTSLNIYDTIDDQNKAPRVYIESHQHRHRCGLPGHEAEGVGGGSLPSVAGTAAPGRRLGAPPSMLALLAFVVEATCWKGGASSWARIPEASIASQRTCTGGREGVPSQKSSSNRDWARPAAGTETQPPAAHEPGERADPWDAPEGGVRDIEDMA